MNKILIFILCSFISACSIYGQRTKELKLSFDKSDFLLKEWDGQLSISSTRYPFQYGADTSEPGLPFVIVHFLIGADEDYSGVKVRFSETSFRDDVFIKNNPTYIVRGSKEASEPVKHVTSYSRPLYPMENVWYSGTHLVDGYKYITFLVCPLKYQTQQRHLDLINDMTLTIELESSKTQPKKAGRAMRDIVQRIVVNGDEMQTLYEKPIVNYRNSFSRDIRSGNDPFDYLIITSESQKAAYQKLADWKTRKGVRTKIVTKEHIDTTFSSFTHDGHECYPLAFKNAIKYYKDNYDIKYVLIGGDTQFIPSLMAYINYNGQLSYVTPCDLYYACLGGLFGHFEWNHNPYDGAYGTYADQVDYHPQLTVSRLSTNSLADANMQVQRIIEYERNPSSEAWQSTVLMMGCKFKELYYDGRPKSDAEIKGSTMWDYYLSQYWQEGQHYDFYDTKTSHTDGANYDVTGTHFIEQLNLGYPFIQIDTHGGEDNLKLEQDTLWTSEIMNLDNPSNTLVVTSACSTNAFDSDECFSEALMRNENSGIIGYWGSSRPVADTLDDCHLVTVDIVNMRLYKHIFNIYNTFGLGECAYLTKLEFINSRDSLYDNMPYTDFYRGVLFTLNLLGDPEMPIYTKTPMEFDGLDIHLINDEQLSFGFNTYNQEFSYFDICVMSLEDNGASYYSIIPHVANGTTLDLPPGHDYSICATQPGFKPFLVNVYRSGFVQNDTIANESIVWSNQAMIGRNVTTTKPQGPVIVEKNQMTIKAPNGVTLKNNFTLKKGASLVIDPNIQYIMHDPIEP